MKKDIRICEARRYNDDGSTQVLLDNEQRLKLKCMGIKAVESN